MTSRIYRMSDWLPAFMLAAFCCAWIPAQSEVVPTELTEYMGRPVAHTMHWKGAGWLLRAEREREESTKEMINALGLKPGDAACDLGSGNGYHSLMMAKITGEKGKVVAVDIQQEMLTMLEKRAKEQGIGNVETVLGKLHDPGLEENSLDLVLIVDAYHEFSHPVHMLQALRKALKKGGRIALVEFRSEDRSVPIKPEHKMSKAQCLKEFSANGFELDSSYDELPWQHLLFFTKREKSGVSPAVRADPSTVKPRP